MRNILIAAASLMILAGSTATLAAPCRDAKGKFTKCPPAAAAPAKTDIVKDAKGKCHIGSGPKKGAFTKCP